MVSNEMKELDSLCMQTQMEELRLRNAERLKVAKESLGDRYVFHPSNMVKRIGNKQFILSRNG